MHHKTGRWDVWGIYPDRRVHVGVFPDYKSADAAAGMYMAFEKKCESCEMIPEYTLLGDEDGE